MDTDEQPRFDPPIEQPTLEFYSMVFLGGVEAEGNHFDLWYTLYQGPDAVAGTYAIFANKADVDRDYNRFVHERACFWRKHGIYDDLPFWRDGANLALEEADRRIRALGLPLSTPPRKRTPSREGEHATSMDK